MDNPAVAKMVEVWLRDNDYSGLWSEECGCEIDDLMPCGEYNSDCQAGYKKDCTQECEHEDTYHTGDWHIQKKKPE